ncbi:MAG: beta/gamma crystallin family protein [Casimicrobiaceae bacterium]
MISLRFARVPMAVAVAALSAAASAGQITLFEDEDFRGNSIRLTTEATSLDSTGMNDKTRSVIVQDGVWEVCRDANFSGGCIQLPPGRYQRMDGNFVRNISSVREIASRSYDAANSAASPVPYPGGAVYPGGGAAQAILYEGHDFQGRQFPMTRDVMNNLDRTGFNDRAGSLRVTGGYWVFCSDANFQGECRTFGPGEYPNLQRELDRRISSGRLISNAYPYSGPPQWERRY